MPRSVHALWLLLRSSHPEPVAGVTVIVTVLALSAGRGPFRTTIMATAVLCGQLLVGWTNDFLDADRDLASGRFDKQHGSPFTDFGEAFNGEEAPAAWALEPDVADPEQNVVRAGMLAILRPMVDSLPPGTIWNRARASREDLQGFLYMAGADWAGLSGGSRRIADGARLFTSNCHDEALRTAVHEIRRKVLAGKSFPPLIAISTPVLDPIVVIEGNKRATAYLFGRKTAINEIPLIVGRSPNMHQFAYW